jgi:multidrug efflux pump
VRRNVWRNRWRTVPKSITSSISSAPVLGELLRKEFPAVRTRISRLEDGPPIGFPVQFRVTGP